MSGEGDIDWVNVPSTEYFRHEFGPNVYLDSSRNVTYKITNQCMVTIFVPMRNIEQVRRLKFNYYRCVFSAQVFKEPRQEKKKHRNTRRFGGRI